MLILRQRISSRHGHDVHQERRFNLMVLLKQVQEKFIEASQRRTQIQVDSVLRQRGERPRLNRQNERTLLFVKPDGVMRGLMGEITRRIENKGLLIIALKLLKLSKLDAEAFYAVHRGKPFFEDLVRHVTSGPVLAMVLEGPNAVSVARQLIGRTSPFEADPGTIRGDFGIDLTKNVVHGSDSVENASVEINHFFGKREILEYEKPTEKKFAH